MFGCELDKRRKCNFVFGSKEFGIFTLKRNLQFAHAMNIVRATHDRLAFHSLFCGRAAEARGQFPAWVQEILERLGHKVSYPEEIVCCGQPPFNSAIGMSARAVAAKVFRAQWQDAEAIVIGSGSCGAMLKEFLYPELLSRTRRNWNWRETNLVAHVGIFRISAKKLGVTDLGAKFPHIVTFHDGCHGLRELGVNKSPRELLAKVSGSGID